MENYYIGRGGINRNFSKIVNQTNLLMNKYTVRTFVIIAVVLLIILYFFELEFRWWFIIPIYLISKYNGTVLKSTKQGFNINNLFFEELSKNDSNQYFTAEIVVDYKGNTKTINGSFFNEFNLTEKDFRLLLFNNAKRNEILSSLESGEPISKTFIYMNKAIKVDFQSVF